MADVLTPQQRRLNMSRIRGKDTKPELMLRQGLHARGLRYRLHRKGLPGRPDIVFPSRRAALLIHGCFWHGHDCPLFKLPVTRREFWMSKIQGNQARDARNIADLVAAGWRVLVVWECSLKGPARQPVDTLLAEIDSWLASEVTCATIQGRNGNGADETVLHRGRKEENPGT
jgi:DNA mismatch endonuclease (patch repair protein)